MTTLAIREKLATYMQIADDKKVKAVYALLETDLEDEFEYSDELKKQLDDGYKYYKNGGKMITAAAASKQVRNSLKKHSKK
jgi:hypothetical protein